jgi:protein-S-isoprenylcysteine O-methyltransferase Ste14
VTASPGGDASTRPPRDHAGVVTFPPLLFAGPFALGWLVQQVRPVALLPAALAPAARLAGWALVVAALTLAGWAVATLRRHRTAVDPFRTTTALVTGGPFARSRNPIYLAFALCHLGGALVGNALPALLLLPVALRLVTWGVIRREERYLALRFGAAYRDYCARVRRWI